MSGRRMIPVRIVAAAAVLALLPLTAACGKKEESKSINIPGLGKIETKGDGKEATFSIKTKEGEVKFESSKTVTEADLGVPIYPGAKSQDGGSLMIAGGGKEKGGSWTAANFTTADPYESVRDFYKGKAGADAQIMETSAEGAKTAMFHLKAKDEKDKTAATVIVSRSKDKPETEIHIQRVSEKN